MNEAAIDTARDAARCSMISSEAVIELVRRMDQLIDRVARLNPDDDMLRSLVEEARAIQDQAAAQLEEAKRV